MRLPRVSNSAAGRIRARNCVTFTHVARPWAALGQGAAAVVANWNRWPVPATRSNPGNLE